MNIRKSLLVSLCAASIGAMSIPMTSSAAVAVYFNSAPPPARHEVVPAPRPGYVWAPGYWDLKGNRHVWVSGHWEHQRHGYYYAEPRWTQHGDKWALERGHWNKGDRDHDGVANAYDRAPNDPYRN